MENNQRRKGGKGELSRKQQKFRVRIWEIVLVIGLIFAWKIKNGENTEIAVKIQNSGGLILAACFGILGSIKESLGKCQFFKEVFWRLLNRVIPWLALSIILFMLPLTIAANAKVDEQKETAKHSEDNLPHSVASENVQQKEAELPKRNREAFVWEEDIYIDDLSEYYDYDGEITEEDKVRYIRELILEDLSHMKQGEVKDMSGFSEDYSVKTTDANYSFELYQEIKDGPYPEENIENALLVAIKYRELADDAQRVSGNLRQLGMLKDTLGDRNYKRGKNSWEKDYEESLKDYILSLKHAVKEVENGLFSTKQSQIEDIWEDVIKEYEKVSGTERILGVLRTM